MAAPHAGRAQERTPLDSAEDSAEDTPVAAQSQYLSQIRAQGCAGRTLPHPSRGLKPFAQAKSQGVPSIRRWVRSAGLLRT
jgi:hypothetical protein